MRLTASDLAREAAATGFQTEPLEKVILLLELLELLVDSSPPLVLHPRLVPLHYHSLPLLLRPPLELTHLPPEVIPQAAYRARELGAELVVVHGETPVEPVPPGTNRAAIASSFVDVLAHPGLLTPDDAERAKRNDVFVEITSRRGHSLTSRGTG